MEQEQEQGEQEQDKENLIPAGNIMTVSKSILERICSFVNIVDEVKVKVSWDEGIRILAVDPAHVAMRDLRIKPSSLEEIEQDMEIAMDLGPIIDMLPLMGKNDTVRIGCTEGRKMLTFKYGRHYHEIAALDVSGFSEPKLPNLDMEGLYKVNIKEMLVSLKMIGKIATHVIFVGDGNNLEAKSDSDGVSYTGSFNDSCVHLGGESVRGLFNIDYVDSILKAHKKLKDTEITIEFSTDYPGKFTVERDGITDVHLLAPRIENE